MSLRRQQRAARAPVRFAVIMAGGESTRLWPLSRRNFPKPFLPLLDGGQSLLQATVERLTPLVGAERILIVGHHSHARLLRSQLPDLPRDQILTEPEARNTAACLCLASAWLASRYSDATMICLPADHLILDANGLRRSLQTAITLAEREGCLVTIGVPPRGPDTGYGYIEPSATIDKKSGARWVKQFIEKPPVATAKRLIRAGALWNAGMFVWQVSDFVAAMEQCAPVFNRAFEGLFRGTKLSPARQRQVYGSVPPQSIDVVLLQSLTAQRQPVRRLAMVPGKFDWEDVGSWNRVAALWPTDADGNATVGETLCVDSRRCVVHSDARMTVAFGVEDLVIVHRDDMVLVTTRANAENIRRLQGLVRERGWEKRL